MKGFKWSGAAVAAAALTMAGTATAAPLPPFTFAPSVLGGGAAGLANVNGDDLTLSDYSTITFTPSGPNSSTFTETGTLDVVQIQLKNADTGAPINQTPGFGMYFSFTATGNQTNYAPTLSSGNFTGLNFSLYGFSQPPSGPVTFQPNNSTPTGVLNPTLLATGSLQGGTVTLVNGIPSANANVNFNVVDPAFFVAPVPFYNIALSAFTNTSSEVSTVGNVITITAGGGTANFMSVPEPVSLALLGTGLFLTGVVRSRRKAI